MSTANMCHEPQLKLQFGFMYAKRVKAINSTPFIKYSYLLQRVRYSHRKKLKKEQEKLKTKVVYMQIFNYDA